MSNKGCIFFFPNTVPFVSACSSYAYPYRISSRHVTTSPICYELHLQVQVTLPDLVAYATSQVIYDESLALYLNSYSFIDALG